MLQSPVLLLGFIRLQLGLHSQVVQLQIVRVELFRVVNFLLELREFRVDSPHDTVSLHPQNVLPLGNLLRLLKFVDRSLLRGEEVRVDPVCKRFSPLLALQTSQSPSSSLYKVLHPLAFSLQLLDARHGLLGKLRFVCKALGSGLSSCELQLDSVVGLISTVNVLLRLLDRASHLIELLLALLAHSLKVFGLLLQLVGTLLLVRDLSLKVTCALLVMQQLQGFAQSLAARHLGSTEILHLLPLETQGMALKVGRLHSPCTLFILNTVEVRLFQVDLSLEVLQAVRVLRQPGSESSPMPF
mmetsp:Transcript_47405/g.148308  ORF Transcript_47405/g.148308 Transcript_47405/m.148308 type:complete len:299 (-) Transcript_47405:796-1692(-)